MSPEPRAIVRRINAIGAPRHGALIDLIDAVQELPPGAEVEVLTDDPGAPAEIARWAREAQVSVVADDREGSACRLVVRVG